MYPTRRPWTAERLARALEPFRAEYGEIVFAAAREESGPAAPDARHFRATQVLLDRDGDNLWRIEAGIDLSGERDPSARCSASGGRT